MNIFQEAAKLLSKNISFAMTTITESKGSTPRHIAKMIVKPDGSIIGTIGGGLSEAYIIEEAVKAIKEKKSRSVEYVLNRNAKEGLAMDCGGKLSVFIEYISSHPKLVLVGGGHVGYAIAKAADCIDFNITIVENREEFANQVRFPFVDSIIHHADLNKALDQLEVNNCTYIVLVTGSNDELALRSLIKHDPAYIGMMGSRRKVASAIGNLKKEGFPIEKLDKVYAPIGLDLGAETPEELAISILSEIMMVKAGKDGSSLGVKAKDIILIRGGGDLATGVAHRLFTCGFQVAILETEHPTVIRRTVSFAQAVYDGVTIVEGVTARKAEVLADAQDILRNGEIPVIIDKKGSSIASLKPRAVVDAILGKKNLGTHRKMAPIVIGLGPGFEAEKDVDAVVETNRGHYLGRVIFSGQAEPNTNTPGPIEGYSTERLIRACCDGEFKAVKDIGDRILEGETLATIDGKEVNASISGIIRGLIQPGSKVSEGMKIGDIDPRDVSEYCDTISDKAKAIGGGVLEAYLALIKSQR